MLFANEFHELTKLTLPIVTVIESVCAPLIVYLALFHSQKMHRYRFLIINNVIWSCFFNWTVWFAKPAFLFPAACVVLDNPLLHRMWLAKLVISVNIVTFLNVELAVAWALLYRYFMAYPGVVSDFVEKGKLFLLFILLIQLGFYGFTFLPFYLHPILSSPDQSIERIRLLDQLPHFEELEPQIGYMCAPNLYLVSAYTLVAFVVYVLAFVIGVVLFCFMFYRVMIVFPRLNMLRTTLKMHKMLFKAVAVQILVGMVFILFPTAILFLTISLRLKEGTSIAAFCIMLVQAHGCVDFITMIYFITPYRRQIQLILGQNYDRMKIYRGSTTIIRRAAEISDDGPELR